MKNPIIDLDGLVAFSKYHQKKIQLGGNEFNVKTLLDWRKIERSYSRFYDTLNKKCKKSWELLASYGKIAKDQGLKSVWIYCEHSDDVYVYENGFLSRRTSEELIKKGLSKPRDVALIIKGKEAQKYFVARRLGDTALKRMWVFRNALKCAVRERIMEFIDQDRYDIRPNRSFILVNEGRNYVFEYRDYTVNVYWPEKTYVIQ